MPSRYIHSRLERMRRVDEYPFPKGTKGGSNVMKMTANHFSNIFLDTFPDITEQSPSSKR